MSTNAEREELIRVCGDAIRQNQFVSKETLETALRSVVPGSRIWIEYTSYRSDLDYVTIDLRILEDGPEGTTAADLQFDADGLVISVTFNAPSRVLVRTDDQFAPWRNQYQQAPVSVATLEAEVEVAVRTQRAVDDAYARFREMGMLPPPARAMLPPPISEILEVAPSPSAFAAGLTVRAPVGTPYSSSTMLTCTYDVSRSFGNDEEDDQVDDATDRTTAYEAVYDVLAGIVAQIREGQLGRVGLLACEEVVLTARNRIAALDTSGFDRDEAALVERYGEDSFIVTITEWDLMACPDRKIGFHVRWPLFGIDETFGYYYYAVERQVATGTITCTLVTPPTETTSAPAMTTSTSPVYGPSPMPKNPLRTEQVLEVLRAVRKDVGNGVIAGNKESINAEIGNRLYTKWRCRPAVSVQLLVGTGTTEVFVNVTSVTMGVQATDFVMEFGRGTPSAEPVRWLPPGFRTGLTLTHAVDTFVAIARVLADAVTVRFGLAFAALSPKAELRGKVLGSSYKYHYVCAEHGYITSNGFEPKERGCPSCDARARQRREAVDALVALLRVVDKAWYQSTDAATAQFALLELDTAETAAEAEKRAAEAEKRAADDKAKRQLTNVRFTFKGTELLGYADGAFIETSTVVVDPAAVPAVFPELALELRDVPEPVKPYVAPKPWTPPPPRVVEPDERPLPDDPTEARFALLEMT